MEAVHHSEVLLSFLVSGKYALFILDRPSFEAKPFQEGGAFVIVRTRLRLSQGHGRWRQDGTHDVAHTILTWLPEPETRLLDGLG